MLCSKTYYDVKNSPARNKFEFANSKENDRNAVFCLTIIDNEKFSFSVGEMSYSYVRQIRRDRYVVCVL